MIRFAALAVLICLPLQAAALSCLTPSVTRSFHQFNNAPETYLIVRGRLTLDMRKLPKNRFTGTPPPKLTVVDARLVGKSMTSNGFSVPFDNAVSLEVACFGPWCGGAQNGDDIIAFVKREAGTYSIAINPCGGAVFSAADPSHKTSLKKCLSGGDCPKD